MKLLVASSYFPTKNDLQDQLKAAGIEAELTFVKTIDEVISELIMDLHHFIITDFEVDETDIWHLAKLVNSAKLAAHSLPIFMIKETFESDIPLILAKANAFKVVSLSELGGALQASHLENLKIGYVRGIKQPEKPSIIIIEDDEDSAYTMSYALNDIYAVDIADDGQSGFELWHDKRHDLVLLDYMLPDINGDIVLEKIMAIDKNQSVIVMTAYDETEYNKTMLLNGASEYLPKPILLDDLRSKCKTILSRAKLIHLEQHADIKSYTLRDLMWILNNAIDDGNIEKAKRVVEKMKTIVPNNLTEDDLINLSSLEF